jgi:hypothetical protein
MESQERNFYDRLPDKAIIEIPARVVTAYQKHAARVKDFGLVFDDLIDDCLVRTSYKETAQADLEEWFDELIHEIVAEGWFDDPNVVDMMSDVAEIAASILEVSHLLYTPSGCHYYEFGGWMDATSVILNKYRYVE